VGSALGKVEIYVKRYSKKKRRRKFTLAGKGQKERGTGKS